MLLAIQSVELTILHIYVDGLDIDRFPDSFQLISI